MGEEYLGRDPEAMAKAKEFFPAQSGVLDKLEKEVKASREMSMEERQDALAIIARARGPETSLSDDDREQLGFLALGMNF
jgi:hypothetical protein